MSPAGDSRWESTVDIDDLDVHLRRELELFFAVYKELEDKKTAALGWRVVEEADRIIAAAQSAYCESTDAALDQSVDSV